jgi:DNA helicase II / ATP-dependent DNA helicase PcrA
MRDFKWENVQEFVSALAEFEQQAQTHSHLDGSLESFIGNVSLDNQAALFAKEQLSQEDRVNLMTFHSAKGLEFPACFLVGMEDHIIPHEKSLLETGVEEERRLMYVAVTRARHYLTVSMAQQRKRMGKDCASRPSRFLFDIPKEVMLVTDWRHVP